MLLLAVTLVFAAVAHMGPLYWSGALVLGALFVVMAVRLRREPTPGAAMALFRYSITYLTLLFVAMAGDILIRFH